MASADGITSSYVGLSLRRFLFNPSSSSETYAAAAAAADRNPLIGATRVPQQSPPRMKRGIVASAFRGLGCASASASRAYSPAAAAVRSSADWQGRQPWQQRRKNKDRKCQVGGDVWCAPGIPFAAEASVDCVVAHQPMVGRGKPEANERINRERAYVPRRVSHQEQISSSMDSPSNNDTSFFAPELLRSRPLHHFRGHYRTPDGLEEIMMFHTRVLLGGGMEMHDRFRDWRLDVDDMSYEELLELGDKIGHVSTGLREEEILRSLKKGKDSAFDSSVWHHSTEVESKCSICQEEYRMSRETGRLECGHSYHMHCIKQWLLLKNACPVCKTPVLKT
ncbi:uncharacterized protein LOC122008854 [Zingiber officinale]|uniref:RING-type E3 ubiquitin transferase n=1 Tax=Zingiber officinale TaxID=94328 RepID=A0A8J5KN23_ZINOF|nr:uncharacterized protein LOC122008854 [Zingiber officinale]KAG6486411.1 hypothetical protein ZIOFF_054981 [Zingiber officinale]